MIKFETRGQGVSIIALLEEEKNYFLTDTTFLQWQDNLFKDSPTGTKPGSRGLQLTNNNTENGRGKEEKEEEGKEEDEKGSEKRA